MMENPYQAPVTFDDPLSTASQGGDAESIRRAHIKHEAQVKSIGSLYWIGAAFILIGLFFLPVSNMKRDDWTGLAVLAGLLVFQIVVGAGLRRLKPWARVASIILSALGLLAFPIGTIINLIILIILGSKKNRVVFSQDYQAIIAATPHVKYKTSKIVWIALGIFVLIVLAIAVALFIGVSNR